MSYVWAAIADTSLDAVIARVLAPLGYHRDPRWVSPYDLRETRCACFTLGPWTVILLNDRETRLGELGFAHVVELTCCEDEWSELIVSRDGARWTLHGAEDDEFLRTSGELPAGLDHYVAEDEDHPERRAQVAIEIARELTGFAVEDDLPASVRIVQLAMAPSRPTLPTGDKTCELALRPREESAHRLVFEIVPADEDAWPPRFDTVSRRGLHVLALTGDEQALAIETTTFPPALSLATSAACTGAALTPWQTTLLALEDSPGQLYELGAGPLRAIELPFERVVSLHDVGAGVVAIPASWSDGNAVPVLITQHAPALPLALAPVAEEADDPVFVAWGDGAFFISWQGGAYRWHQGALAALQPLAGAASAIPLADGSIVVACTAGLVRIWPDDRREHVGLFADPQQVLHGPGDAVIVIDKSEQTCLKIWWPATNEVVAVAWEVFDLEWDPELVYYDAIRDLLVIIARHLHAVPWRVLAALPRT